MKELDIALNDVWLTRDNEVVKIIEKSLNIWIGFIIELPDRVYEWDEYGINMGGDSELNLVSKISKDRNDDDNDDFRPVKVTV